MRRHIDACVLKQLSRNGIDLRPRTNSGAESLELAVPDGIRESLGDHAARGISLRQKQDFERVANHEILLQHRKIGAISLVRARAARYRNDRINV
jgi:hypothetical protein